LERAIAAGVTPGAVAVVGEGARVVAGLAVGSLRSATGGEPAPCAELESLYDIASLTKPLATTACVLRLATEGRLELEAPVAPLLPELRAEGTARITIRQLLGHASGFPAHVPFYERLWAGAREGADSAREALLRMVGATPLEAEPGSRVAYSDLGFIALGFALERLTGERLDALASRLIFKPLGMTRTRYVDLTQLDRPEPVAPTELCRVRGLLRGEVHDENAHAAGGICGHAGLFSTAPDVAAFARELCRAASGDPDARFAPELVRALFRERGGPGSTWRLGFDTPSPEPGVSSAGDRWPAHGVGHLGFTGTSMWIDPDEGRYVVLLTNRVHPSREREGIRGLRRELMDAAADAFGYPSRF
jgi:CubicO group peptidase (beta-lactamase class C family)